MSRTNSQTDDKTRVDGEAGRNRSLLTELQTSPEGLPQREAEHRLERHGPNELETQKRSTIRRLFSHFWGPIPWMLEAAVILAAVAQRWEDFGVILVMLLINGGVSFWHENRADRAIEALKQQLAPKARVLRDSRRCTIEARELVPGDVMLLRLGDVVPADAALLEGQYLSADESALTGESLPVDKGSGDRLYSGTTVKQGEARAVITATGYDTRFARTVQLVEIAQEKSHFQKAVLRIGYVLISTTLVLVAIVLAVAITRGDPVFHVLLLALGLTLAGIPQALPAVLSVTMTVGANRLARLRAIVSRLAAMEEMAGLEVLCADKTGTLTRNELQLQQPVVIDAEDEHELILAAALTCRGEEEDPIDGAILRALEDSDELDRYNVTAFRPFDPSRKRAEADVESDGEQFTVAKGAPQAILELVEPDDQVEQRVNDEVERLAEAGYRSLGVARRRDNQWHYLGILPLLDPPREDSAGVIGQAERYGIDVRMVTGDHMAIGRRVAAQLGMGQRILPASELFREHRQSEAEQAHNERIRREVLESDGFAEVTPEHKFKLVTWFQEGDRIVGMTGDGVNDAPALKQADVGIAVDRATDAARAAADLVLTAPGLGVIIRAVEEARRIFERMTGYATFRITETLRVLLFVSISILAFGFYPVTPIMIVLLAILNDIPIMTIAWDNAPTAGRPVRWDMGRVLAIAGVLSVTGVASSFLLFWYLHAQTALSEPAVQTMMFLKLLVAGHLTIFMTRTRKPMWRRPWPALSLFLALEGTQIAGTLVAVYGIGLVHPVGWLPALAVWGYALVVLVVLDRAKLLTHRIVDVARRDNTGAAGSSGGGRAT